MRNKKAEDLSVEEIRFLLVEKRRASRNIRLGRFRKTGRVMPFAGDPDVSEDFETGLLFGRTKIRNT